MNFLRYCVRRLIYTSLRRTGHASVDATFKDMASEVGEATATGDANSELKRIAWWISCADDSHSFQPGELIKSNDRDICVITCPGSTASRALQKEIPIRFVRQNKDGGTRITFRSKPNDTLRLYAQYFALRSKGCDMFHLYFQDLLKNKPKLHDWLWDSGDCIASADDKARQKNYFQNPHNSFERFSRQENDYVKWAMEDSANDFMHCDLTYGQLVVVVEEVLNCTRLKDALSGSRMKFDKKVADTLARNLFIAFSEPAPHLQKSPQQPPEKRGTSLFSKKDRLSSEALEEKMSRIQQELQGMKSEQVMTRELLQKVLETNLGKNN